MKFSLQHNTIGTYKIEAEKRIENMKHYDTHLEHRR